MTRWIEDEIKPQWAALTTEPEPIEPLQRLDAAAEHARSTLRIDVFFQVTGKRCDHVHTMLRQKLGQPLESGLAEYRQVASIDDPQTALAKRGHQQPKVRV